MLRNASVAMAGLPVCAGCTGWRPRATRGWQAGGGGVTGRPAAVRAGPAARQSCWKRRSASSPSATSAVIARSNASGR